MAPITVTLNDPQAQLASLPWLVPTIRAAVGLLDSFLVIRGTVDIEVNVETTGTGRFAGGGDISFAGRRNGLDTWEASLVAESRTGVDPDPRQADLSIYIDPTSSYLAQLWWDPSIASGLSGRPPMDRTDAFSVVLHELLHGLGVIGYRDTETGALSVPYQTVWDSLVSVAAGRASFNGEAARALVGEPLEVRLGGSQGAFHLGHGPWPENSQQPWLVSSQLNSYYFYTGERYTLGRLELAVLQDLGWSLEPGLTLTDVVNRWDSGENALFMVGWETDESLVGDALDDRIEGRGGNDVLLGLAGQDQLFGGEGRDTLVGGSGNDVLDGGPGLDSAVFGGLLAEFTRTRSGDAWLVAQGGALGTDTLRNVERLAFDDAKVALDLGTGAAAGQAVLLIGAVLGGAPVREKRELMEAVIGLFDEGYDLPTLAGAVMRLPIWNDLAGSSAPDAIAGYLHQRVNGRPATPAELAAAVTAIEQQPQGAYLAGLAASPANALQVDLVGLAAVGLVYG